MLLETFICTIPLRTRPGFVPLRRGGEDLWFSRRGSKTEESEDRSFSILLSHPLSLAASPWPPTHGAHGAGSGRDFSRGEKDEVVIAATPQRT